MNKLSLIIKKLSVIGSLFAGFMCVVLVGTFVPKITNAIPDITNPKFCKAPGYVEVVKTIKMIITAYSSTEDQTDDTPFITASGKYVEDGIIANNMLSFGTKVRIPEIYGDKIFIVEDRMHKRKGKYQADVWMAEYKQAKEFGAKWNVKVEILES